MKKTLLILSFLLATLALSSCSKKSSGYAEYWKTWGDLQITNWSLTAHAFAEQVELFCRAEGSLDGLQHEYRKLALQWAQMNGFPYKAVTDFNLGFELYFWPDKRNMTAARLAKRVNQETLTLEQLQKATVAEKGLLAMEWLSFEAGLDKTQRCNALPAISAQYEQNVQKILDYHQNNPLVLLGWLNGHDNPEGQSISLNLLFQQIAQISNRLRTSLNHAGEIIPILSEGWRAGTTQKIYMASLSSSIRHLQALSEHTDITVNSQGLLQDHIDNLSGLLNEMQTGIARWQELQQALIDIEHLIEGPIAQDLDVLIGFNNYDGD